MEKSAAKKTKAKAEKKPKLTDKERHERFVDVARDVGADETSEAFDKAFDKIVKPLKPKASHFRQGGS